MRGSSVFLKERSLQVDNYSPVILYRRIHGTMHGGIPEIMEILPLSILNGFILMGQNSLIANFPFTEHLKKGNWFPMSRKPSVTADPMLTKLRGTHKKLFSSRCMRW